MNKQNRKDLQIALELFQKAKEIIDDVKNQEYDKFENLPENLKQSEKGSRFETNVETLYTVLDDLESSTSNIKDVIHE